MRECEGEREIPLLPEAGFLGQGGSVGREGRGRKRITRNLNPLENRSWREMKKTGERKERIETESLRPPNLTLSP